MWRVFRIAIDAAVILALIVFAPGLPPYGDLQPYTFPPAMQFEGPLAPNDVLNRAEKLYEGQINGPEAFAVSPDNPDVIYTGLGDGSVIRISENATKIERVGPPTEVCHKRPLGIRFDREGKLVIADAYCGIYKLDPKSGKYELLVSKDASLDGKPALLFNSVSPAKDGAIYWTDSSTNYPLHQGVGEMLGVPSGRLFRYDPETKQSTKLLDGLHFANGVMLSPDEDFVLVVECFQMRIRKYWLKGSKKGTAEIFVEGLPGTPDNISLSPDGNPMVGIITVRFPGQLNPLEVVFQLPLLRKLLLRMAHMIIFPLDLADKYLNLPFTRTLSHFVLSMVPVSKLTPDYALIMELDWNGNILKSWNSNGKGLRLYSEGVIAGDYMYLGSPWNNYLGRVNLS